METVEIVDGEEVGDVVGVNERGEEIGVVVIEVVIPLVGGVTRTMAAVDAAAIAIAAGTCDVGSIGGCAAAAAAPVGRGNSGC